MLPGQTFFWSETLNIKSHRWVIVSDPKKDPLNVVMVSLTTFRPGASDPVCVLSPAEYSDLDRETCAHYVDVKRTTLGDLVRLADQRLISLSSVVPYRPLGKIRSGLATSKDVPGYLKAILRKQGLIT